MGKIILCLGGCFEYRRIFRNILCLYKLNASRTRPSKPLSCDNQKYLQILPEVLWGTESPLVESH